MSDPTGPQHPEYPSDLRIPGIQNLEPMYSKEKFWLPGPGKDVVMLLG